MYPFEHLTLVDFNNHVLLFQSPVAVKEGKCKYYYIYIKPWLQLWLKSEDQNNINIDVNVNCYDSQFFSWLDAGIHPGPMVLNAQQSLLIPTEERAQTTFFLPIFSFDSSSRFATTPRVSPKFGTILSVLQLFLLKRISLLIIIWLSLIVLFY